MNDAELLEQAKSMLKRAYIPYSKFAVGAALLCKNGKVFKGCNIENAAYGASICAERAAVAQAVCAGENEFDKIAIISSGEEVCTPCGICRQVLVEFSPDMTVICARGNGSFVSFIAKELLPHHFSSESM